MRNSSLEAWSSLLAGGQGRRLIDGKNTSVHSVDRSRPKGRIGGPTGRERGLLLHIHITGLVSLLIQDFLLKLVLELIGAGHPPGPGSRSRRVVRHGPICIESQA